MAAITRSTANAWAILIVTICSHATAEPTPHVTAALAEYDAAIKQMQDAFALVPGEISDKEWVTKKLQHMVDMDQYMRKFMSAPHDRKFTHEEQREYLEQLVTRALTLDRQNTADLKELLKIYPWFTISEFGKKADGNAWLLVQHADHDPEFQREILAKLEKLYPTGETRPANYAYLYDRLAASWHDPTKRRLQRFGTQGQCTAPGKWEPLPMEDPENVDRRRAAVGLPPLADYIAGFKDVCK
jgi:hypothetical protein